MIVTDPTKLTTLEWQLLAVIMYKSEIFTFIT